MKALLTIILLLIFSACNYNSNKTFEYKVVEFQREDAPSFKDTLNNLGANGWEYVGELTANGINGRYVAFKRKK